MQVLSKFTALVPPVASPLSLTLPSTLLSSFILVFFPFPLTWVRKQIVTSMDRISIKMIIVLIPVQQNKMESRYRSFCPRLYTERRANREKRKENSPGLNKTLAQEKLHSCFEILTESRYQWKVLLCNTLVGAIDGGGHPRFSPGDSGSRSVFIERHWSSWGCAESADTHAHSTRSAMQEK